VVIFVLKFVTKYMCQTLSSALSGILYLSCSHSFSVFLSLSLCLWSGQGYDLDRTQEAVAWVLL